jgi:hypothetical protein
MARAIDFDHDHPLLHAIRAGLCGGFRAGAGVPGGAAAHV